MSDDSFSSKWTQTVRKEKMFDTVLGRHWMVLSMKNLEE